MAYYEFLNLPEMDSWDASAKTKTLDPAKRDGTHNAWSETGTGGDLRISLSLSTVTNDRGWIGAAPESAIVTIHRKVKTHSGGVAEESPNIQVGDLILYRLSLLSTKSSWNVERANKDKWPKAYLEFDTQHGVRLRADLERLVVDSWSLHVTSSEAVNMVESLVMRAWVVSLSRSSGNALRVALGDSDSD